MTTHKDATLYSAVLMADSTMTTCRVTFADSDKQYVYQIGTDLAKKVTAGDKALVDHNGNKDFHLVTIVSVDIVPDCSWSQRTRSVIAVMSLQALEDRREEINEYRNDLYNIAKEHVDNETRKEVAENQKSLQDSLGLTNYFS